MNDLLKAALRYARRGWRVFPLNGKEPLIKGGHNRASTDEDRIKRWWDQWPEANIGIACDSENGPIVIDIDAPKKGETGAIKFLRKMGAYKELVTRTAISGAGGRHLYLAPMRNGTRIKRMLRPFRDKKGRKVALDILGDGGYVVAPPSIHPDTGKTYKWSEKIDLLPFPKRIFRFLEKRDIHNVAPPLPDIIREGERDSQLTSLAGSMRRRSATPEAILEALRVENAARVRPPLTDRQLKKIAFSIGKKSPVADDEHLTDLGNARRFVAAHHKKVRSILVQRHPWLVWQGSRWEPDVTGEVERMAKLTVRALYKDAAECTDDDRRDELLKHALKSESSPRIRAMIELASTEPEISLTPEQLDANPWLLNIHNGTIDLKTGELHEHRRGDYITKLAPVFYDEKAECPRWEQFLAEVLDGNTELIEFVQRAVGYSLTGDVREQVLFFLYGQGSNGKSTFMEIIRSLCGDYATQADFRSFQSVRGDGPRSDIARMRAARFVAAVEARGERGFDETIVKQITGTDVVVARKLYEDEIEFKPQFKLWLAANHKPMVKEQTEAFWRRIRLIPFTVVIPANKRKKTLGEKLTKELSGILNWALAGCAEWREHGLMPPTSVVKATKEYKEEHDVLGEFLASNCVLDPKGWTSATSLYTAFTDWWMETRGHRSTPVALVGFSRLLSERSDISARKRENIRGWKGILLQDVKSE